MVKEGMENLATGVIMQAIKDYYSGDLSEYQFRRFCLNSIWFELYPEIDRVVAMKSVIDRKEKKHGKQKVITGEFKRKTF